MSMPRSFSRSNALRSERIDPVAAQAYRASVHAASLEAMRAKTGTKFWTTTGGFDRRAIMAYVVANARCERINRPARDPAGLATILAVGTAPGFAVPAGASELHVHRLAATAEDRAAIVDDLR